nr:hypothetical protein [Anaerolineae bacterium]
MSEKRPDPAMFVEISYYLAFASTGILLMTFILGVLRIEALRPLGQLIWLALITSAVGTFLAFAARSEYKKAEPTDEEAYKLRIGLRVNLATLAFMIIFALFVIVVALLPTITV